MTSIKIDTEIFTDDYDFLEFARKLLGGESGVGSLPGDQGPLDWLARALPHLRSTPFEERLTRAIAGCLTDDNPIVRREALRFFEAFPQAAGAERVVEIAGGDRQLFAGVPDPDGTVDLEWSLLRVLGARINVGDSAARDTARREAVSTRGNPEPLIAALTSNDPDWVMQNAEHIVSLHPSTGSTILHPRSDKGP